jgi:hypothetical protein
MIRVSMPRHHLLPVMEKLPLSLVRLWTLTSFGTPGRDVIPGLEGFDVIDGGGGNDLIFGG